MTVDWFTVAAQALNFVVLVWLLKRLLYKPILSAIEAREKSVADELATAAAQCAEAAKQHEEFQRKLLELEGRRTELMAQATAAAGAEQQRLLTAAKAAAAVQRTRLLAAVDSEATSLLESIGQRTQQEVFAIARTALAQLASVSLEASVCEVFTSRLRELSGAARTQLSDALRAPAEPALVRSAFELSAPQREAIERVLKERFDEHACVRFERASALIAGVELSAGGQKVAWSVSDYLARLEQTVRNLASAASATSGSDPRPPSAAPASLAPREQHA